MGICLSRLLFYNSDVLLQEPFSTPFYSIVKTWVMMIGEFDYNDIFHTLPLSNENPHYEEITYFFFITFLIVMSIVLMNLLIGLAVDDVGALQSHAKLQKIACQVSFASLFLSHTFNICGNRQSIEGNLDSIFGFSQNSSLSSHFFK